jgi:hypothetical protein
MKETLFVPITCDELTSANNSEELDSGIKLLPQLMSLQFLQFCRISALNLFSALTV